MPDFLQQDIQYLPGVGAKRAKLLNSELHIYTFADLLGYFPYKYVDRSRVYRIGEIDGNMPYIQIRGSILSYETFGEGRHRRLVAHFSDGSGIVDLVWFQGINYITKNYNLHKEYIVFGKPSMFGSRINIAHPDIDDVAALDLSRMGLQPFYNTTEKMKRGGLNSHSVEKLVKTLLLAIKEKLPETMAGYVLAKDNLASRDEAIRGIHCPLNPDDLRRAQLRLKYEELFYVQMSILRYAKSRSRKYRGFVMPRVGEAFNKFYSENLPFELTGAQKRVVKEIRADMCSGRQMNRLLQGDVGSGKTLVALMSMLIAIGNKKQCCIMAPTEILATQHYETMTKLLRGVGVRVELLTG
ncbi:MAG: DEAD/DEAH box helicase, partial [Bacteroidaceae bacterium]|nr:DEAD/DEAH box helicase [Bacteroidaceae bacterium]